MERELGDQTLLCCQSACDAALVCSCREDMVLAASMFDEVATEYGLTLSVPKTKLLVAGLGLTNDDLTPLELNGDSGSG